MVRTYTIVVEPEETGGYLVTVPALPGCFSQGRTAASGRPRPSRSI